VDLRVEDHAEPVKEIRRLVAVHRAYQQMNEGDERLARNDVAGAMEAYGVAAKLLPDNPEVKYWAAITMVTAGRDQEALAYFKDVFRQEPKWVEVTRRLPASGLLPDDPDLMKTIMSAAPGRKR
jgi:predicted Zn-dependent protease